MFLCIFFSPLIPLLIIIFDVVEKDLNDYIKDKIFLGIKLEEIPLI
jgi:hypothetical protein